MHLLRVALVSVGLAVGAVSLPVAANAQPGGAGASVSAQLQACYGANGSSATDTDTEPVSRREPQPGGDACVGGTAIDRFSNPRHSGNGGGGGFKASGHGVAGEDGGFCQEVYNIGSFSKLSTRILMRRHAIEGLQ